MSLIIGQLIAERYQLIRKIAVGGMGEVWEASDTRLGRRVAIKVLKAELSGDTEFLQRFRVEARTTASLNHPGVAAVHDYGETAAIPGSPADTAYLVMELVDGEPLAAMIARRRRLTPERTLDVLEQAGQALQAAHERGLVHRDVKPGNILLSANGTVKITDFGIAKAADAAPVTRSGMVMGTAHYIAPEQAMGQDAGPASDVYSLGVVGYECLTGHRPFLSDSAVTVAMMHIRDLPPPLPSDVPPGIRALIELTLVKDPRSRYGNGGEFAAAVAAVKAGRPLPKPAGAYLGPNAPSLSAGQLAGSVPSAALALPTAEEAPTGPQQRMGGPATPPRSGPFGPPQVLGVRRGRQQRRQRSVAPWIVVGLLLAATLAVGAWILAAVLDEGGTGQSLTVTVREGDYRGQPVGDVSRSLTERGLHPNVHTEDGSALTNPATCAVTNVTPTGNVDTGSSVTVTCQQESG